MCVDEEEVSSVLREEEVSSVSSDTASPKEKEEPSPPPEEEKKKARGAKSASPSHPPYFQMIKEALMALMERGGSSSRAIAKHVEEGNYKSALPAHFRKMLKVQLNNCVARGRLLKVKGSYKLPKVKKPAAAPEAKPAESTKGRAKTAKKVARAKSNKLKWTKSPVHKKATEAAAA